MFPVPITQGVAKTSRCYDSMDSQILRTYSPVKERNVANSMQENSSMRGDKVFDELDELWEELSSATESSASDASLMSAVEKILKINESESEFSEDDAMSEEGSSADESEMSAIGYPTKNVDEPTKQGSWCRLRAAMKQSRLTQEMLQEHDRKQGLPRSHCVTMVHTNRSRRQLEEGHILPKWNGEPLISKKEKDNKMKKQTTARAA